MRAPGKTRTITHRIAYGVHTGVYVPEQVLAVTFTARAAGELRGRLAALDVGGVQARTFHAAAMRQLRYFAPRVLGGPMPSLVENKLRLVADGGRARPRLSTDRTSLRDLASEIEWAKTTLATPEDYPARAKAAGREPPFDAAAVAAVYAGYESAKQRDGALDFEDLLLVTAYALEEHPDVARAGPRPVPALRRRRVPGRQPAAAAAARRVARRPGGRLRRRRPEPDDLLLHRRRTPTTCWASPTAIPMPAWSSSNATTAPPRRWWRWPTG